MSNYEDEDATSSPYSRKVGERLRAIRRQKRLSLQEVESTSTEEFKASVLGAYERGERAISVPRLQRLARFYNVPVDQLLPREDGRRRATRHGVDEAGDRPAEAGAARRQPVRDAGPLPADDPGAAPGLQRQGAHDPRRRHPGHRGMLDVPVDHVGQRLDELDLLYQP